MNETYQNHVITAFSLTPKQRDAVLARGCDVAVTAGAGSGKTSTLVARYASLLADGVDVRRVIAITFSEKATREMRSRVRKILTELVTTAESEEERQFWAELETKMDSARISTIHSLCAEILRAHPAEAKIDPRFDILDEGLTAALKAQVVDDTMAKLVELKEFIPLFSFLEIKDLKNLMGYLLDKRLEAREAFENDIDIEQAMCTVMESLINSPDLAKPIADLRSMERSFSVSEGDEKPADQVKELLDLWSKAQDALAKKDVLACVGYFYHARREKMNLHLWRKDPALKEIVKALQGSYDELINPIFGGKSPNDDLPNAETEANFIQVLQLVKIAFNIMVSSYADAQNQLRALDFDDLEYGAVKLLETPEIQEKWQNQIDAVLVDEFQDTNQRQRVIVEALANSPGKLFVFGDAKQSIYRFRRADVTVFRALRRSIKEKGGMPIDLNKTFRAHAPLLAGMNGLLKTIMGEEEDPSRPYYEPFSALTADREEPRDGILSPHIEFVYGNGEDAKTGRMAAARALAVRLIELKQQGQIKKWDDVTLLFRASTGFPYYEDAFEEANIPFLTVAGKGFYERAEIRDVLNILHALADPTDDLAMAGLLRSPAFGLTDAALYQLRWMEKKSTHYWTVLHGDVSILEIADLERAKRAVAILDELIPMVDRIPVAELLKKLVDATDYRAILAIEDQNGGGGRLWRNLDKLIEDAQGSGKVNVRDFLDYLKIINDAGAREGEASTEALGSVRLMTIHKSKGLQFQIVVLADASRKPLNISETAFLSEEIGLAFKMDPDPLLYRLAKMLDNQQDDAEDVRILYVALTRAQEKLIINGHATFSEKKGWSAASWLNELSFAAEVDVNDVISQAGEEVIRKINSGQEIRAWALPNESVMVKEEGRRKNEPLPDGDNQPICAPLNQNTELKESEDEPRETHGWRATGSDESIPPGVVGHMVHKAIELWMFPGNPGLIPLLESAVLDAGLAQQSQRVTAIDRTVELLIRLRNHPIWEEIESATEVYHELPYSRMIEEYTETGYIDLLYCSSGEWQIIDFKTDSIRSADERADLIDKYSRQMWRYASAVETLIGQRVKTRICFLNDHDRMELVKIN